MPICPSGHDSGSGDYCDVCGLAISSGPASAAAPANSAATAPGTAGSGPVSGPAQAGQEFCPEPGCGAPRAGRFCEECGYDFATGRPGFGPVSADFGPPPATSPPGGYGPHTGGYPPPPGYPPPGAPGHPHAQPGFGPPSGHVPQTGTPGHPGHGTAPPGPHGYGTAAPPHPGPGQTAGQPVGTHGRPYPGTGPATGAPPGAPAGPPYTGWHAVVSADRQYFDSVIAQGGPDAAKIVSPPYCPERVFPLVGNQVRIGRRSRSRGLNPEIDLSGPPEDPGVSHLHAILVAQPDGSWALIDPGSANGTKINDAPDPIATNVPVPVSDGDRIYVGAWTVIVLRKG